MANLSKAEYLKRYLSASETADGKKKKRKKIKTGVKESKIKIFDDDIDLAAVAPTAEETEAKEEELLDDAPTVADIIDDRPEDIKQIEAYRQSTKWKTLQDEEKAKQRRRHDSDSDTSLPRNNRDHSGSDDESPRRKRHDSDSDNSLPRKVSAKSGNNSDSDASPPRKRRLDSSSDESPPRRQRQNSDNSPPRRKRHDSGSDDNSPPRRKSKGASGSPKRRQRHDSDASPPRRRPKSDSQDSDASPPRRNRNDSDSSPPRKRKNAESDSSPPRRKRNKSDSDQSPPRKDRARDGSNSRQGSSTKTKPDRQSHRQPDRSSRKRQSDSDSSPPRKIKQEPSSSPRKKGRERSPKERKRKTRWEEEEDGKMRKTLGGAKAGLSSAKDMKKEMDKLRAEEDAAFKNVDDKVLGKGAATVVRGKKKTKEDLEKEAAEAEHERKKAEQYKQWGKGLAQQAEQDQRLQDALHEASKPLARYRDDEDLDAMLKSQDRDGDPMLAFIKKKKIKDAKKEKPKYQGPQPPPNRFNIPPGYRWDGVDRSNGFEKQFFKTMSDKKAVKEIAYKWSVEDM